MTRTYTGLTFQEYITADRRFDDNRAPIDTIILHSTAGSLQAAINLFSSIPAQGRETSAHYIIDNSGNIHAGLEEYYVAYHAGNYDVNRRSIGIEHVDEGPQVKLHTDAQYEKSALLVADICREYKIPCDSDHIKGHNQIVATACPNGLDVPRIIAMAQKILSPTSPLEEERNRLNDAIRRKDEQIKKAYLSLPDVDKSVEDPDKQMAVLIDRIPKLSTELSGTKESYLLLSKEHEKCQSKPDSCVELQDKLTKITNRLNKLLTSPSKKQLNYLIAISEKLGVEI